MELLSIALLGLAAYLIGSVSPSYTLVHYLKGIDIREVGSRNAGTLNSYHQLGAWWAVLVFLVDAGKAAVATLLPMWVGLPEWAALVTAPLVIIGHNWTVLLKFRGGKGAACLIGIFLALAPAATMIAILPGVIVLFLSKNAIVALAAGFTLANVLFLAAWLFNLEVLVLSPGWQQFALCLALNLFVAVVYGISIKGQLLEAFRGKSVKRAFYGSWFVSGGLWRLPPTPAGCHPLPFPWRVGYNCLSELRRAARTAHFPGENPQ